MSCIACKPLAPLEHVPIEEWRARLAGWPPRMDVAFPAAELRALVELAATAGEAAHAAAFAGQSDPGRAE